MCLLRRSAVAGGRRARRLRPSRCSSVARGRGARRPALLHTWFSLLMSGGCGGWWLLVRGVRGELRGRSLSFKN